MSRFLRTTLACGDHRRKRRDEAAQSFAAAQLTLPLVGQISVSDAPGASVETK